MDEKRKLFLAILEKHQGIIFKVASMYCQNKEDQKDLAQDIIVELWKSFDKYDSAYKFSTWMYRVALNVAISYYRKSRTQKKYITTIDFDLVNISFQEGEDNDLEVQLLRNFINQLDEMNKVLMILYLEGNSHQEIAAILNISTSNVGTKIGRIKQKLKAEFKKNE